ncbi:Potassium channel protein, partial [hydrothermal vent metagenome]
LAARGVDYRIIERDRGKTHDAEHTIIGDATDPQVLRQAGLDEAPAVLVTTHDDNLNIYATIYCRSVRPDVLIVSRSTLERNTETLHRAGADFVFSYASMGATSLFNLIRGSRIVSIAEGLDVFRMAVPRSLEGKTIVESGVRERTGCTIVAVRGTDEGLMINPPPHETLEAGCEMVLVGSLESESRFLKRYSDG